MAQALQPLQVQVVLSSKELVGIVDLLVLIKEQVREKRENNGGKKGWIVRESNSCRRVNVFRINKIRTKLRVKLREVRVKLREVRVKLRVVRVKISLPLGFLIGKYLLMMVLVLLPLLGLVVHSSKALVGTVDLLVLTKELALIK